MVSGNKKAEEMRRVIDWMEPHMDYIGFFGVSFPQYSDVPTVSLGCLQDMIKVASGSQVVVEGPDKYGLYTLKTHLNQTKLFVTTTSYGTPIKAGTYTLDQNMFETELVS